MNRFLNFWILKCQISARRFYNPLGSYYVLIWIEKKKKKKTDKTKCVLFLIYRHNLIHEITMKRFRGLPLAMESDLLIVWSVAFAVTGIIVIVINSLTLYSFSKNKLLQTRRHFMIINLTVADLLFGVTGMSSAVFYLLNPSDISFCLFAILNMFTKLACLITLCLIAIERMHAIVWPLRHQVLGCGIYKAALVLSWILSAVAATTSIVSVYTYNSVLAESILPVLIAAGIITMFTSYISIWVSVHRRKKDKHNTASNQDKGLAITLLLVAGTFVVTFVIPVLYMSISHLCSCYKPSLSVTLLTYLAPALESVINPVIYCFRIPGFQDKLKLKMVTLNCFKKRVKRRDATTELSKRKSAPNNETQRELSVLWSLIHYNKD